MSPRPFLIAHRGASTHHRENSPAAWRGALQDGADMIEADTRMTADHQIVISHDADLSRLAGRDTVIAQSTLAELQLLRADGGPAAPPLAELFAMVPPVQPILFDVKDENPPALAALVAAARGSGRGNLWFGLHRIDSLQRLRALGWAGPVLGLLSDLGEAPAFFAHGGTVLRLWESDALSDPDHLLRARRSADQPVWITTGNCAGRAVGDHDPQSLRDLHAQGAAGFLVNDPAACRAVLAPAHSASAARP